MNTPWMIAGDLNTMLNSSEKWNEVATLNSVGFELQEFIDKTDLEDHGYSGPIYTWSNNHTFCKLDRVLVSKLWYAANKDSVVMFLPSGISDHSPSVTKVFKEGVKRSILFRFKNTWAADKNFLKIVEDIWAKNVDGCCMFQLVTKLKMLKGELKKLNATMFQNLQQQVLLNLQKLHYLQET